jgi:hypothetical protein
MPGSDRGGWKTSWGWEANGGACGRPQTAEADRGTPDTRPERDVTSRDPIGHHRHEDAESGSSSRPSAGFGDGRGRVRLLPLEGPRTGGDRSFAGTLPDPSWPCEPARTRSARSTPAVARWRVLPTVTGRDHHLTSSSVQRSPFRRGSPAWSPLPATTSWRLRERPATAAPRSVPVVSHHLDGFLLQTAARVLHRAPDRRVRRVRPPREGPAHRLVRPSEPSLRR